MLHWNSEYFHIKNGRDEKLIIMSYKHYDTAYNYGGAEILNLTPPSISTTPFIKMVYYYFNDHVMMTITQEDDVRQLQAIFVNHPGEQ